MAVKQRKINISPEIPPLVNLALSGTSRILGLFPHYHRHLQVENKNQKQYTKRRHRDDLSSALNQRSKTSPEEASKSGEWKQ